MSAIGKFQKLGEIVGQGDNEGKIPGISQELSLIIIIILLVKIS